MSQTYEAASRHVEAFLVCHMPQKATELDPRRFTFAMFPVLAIAATSHALLRPSLPHLSPTLVHNHDRLLALRGGDYTMQELISETPLHSACCSLFASRRERPQ